MRVWKEIPNELKCLINAILKRNGDCEHWLNGYNRNPCGFIWHGFSMICEPLFCSYGRIGYGINYRGYEIHVDNELSRIEFF